MTWTLVIHGGAGKLDSEMVSPEQDAGARAGLLRALDVGAKVLADGGGALDAGERLDLRGLEAAAGDGEVLDGALRLGGVERVPRDPHLAHRVVLDAELVRRAAV